MTAINCLVDAADGMDGQMLESMSVLQGAVLSVQALCESFLAALANVPAQDYFRAEFRMPSEPRDFQRGAGAHQQEPANVSVGIDVYAIARQIQDAMGRMQKEAISIPAVCSSLASPGGLSMPDTSAAREISRELTREYTSDVSKKIIHESAVEIREHHVTDPPRHMLEKPRSSTGGRWFMGRSRGLAARSPENRERAGMHDKKEPGISGQTIRKTSLSQDTEQHIKRSTLVLSEMESIVRNVMSSTTIGSEVMQPSSDVRLLQHALTASPAVPAPVEAQAPSGEIATAPQLWPVSEKGVSSRVPDMIEAARPALSLQKAHSDALENARSLSDALARNTGTQGVPPTSGTHDHATEPGPIRPADSHTSPVTYVSRAMSTIINTYATAGGAAIAQSLAMAGATLRPSVDLSAKPAMPGEPIVPQASIGTIFSIGQPAAQPNDRGSGGILMGYEDVALNVSRSIEALNSAGPGAAIQSPIISLINHVAVPSPAGTMAQATAMPAGGYGVIAQAMQPRGPAVTLAVSMAATHAAQRAGASAIKEFVLASPSMAGGVQAPVMADRNMVNVTMPSISVDRELSSSVNKTSNFHNTFNINITMKSGGEDGDLKELGKKIGRILSDEIKRYGGA